MAGLSNVTKLVCDQVSNSNRSSKYCGLANSLML